MAIPSEGEIFTVLSLIVPGFIIARTREQFTTGRRGTVSQELVEYVALGATNFAVFSWLIYLLTHASWSLALRAGGWFAVLLVGPVLIGLCMGIAAQKQWTRKLLGSWPLNLLGAKSVHVMPTAWDWKFAGMPQEWVLVTFKDGSRIAGLCGDQSFISSEPSERDLYLERVFSVGDDNSWTPTRKGILITHGEISTIEFWPEESDDEERGQGIRAVGEGSGKAQATIGIRARNGTGQAIRTA